MTAKCGASAHRGSGVLHPRHAQAMASFLNSFELAAARPLLPRCIAGHTWWRLLNAAFLQRLELSSCSAVAAHRQRFGNGYFAPCRHGKRKRCRSSGCGPPVDGLAGRVPQRRSGDAVGGGVFRGAGCRGPRPLGGFDGSSRSEDRRLRDRGRGRAERPGLGGSGGCRRGTARPVLGADSEEPTCAAVVTRCPPMA
jgi:hypothetical protein